MNWDYIAGFFDGEGTFGNYGSGYKISVTQTNKKVLEKIQSFTKLGHIHHLKKRKSHWKDAWVYYIAKQEDVYIFLNKILDKLVVKKETSSKALPKLRKKIKNRERQRIRTIKRKRQAKNLRKEGFSYRQIGKKLGIDWGYARRLILDLEQSKKMVVVA